MKCFRIITFVVLLFYIGMLNISGAEDNLVKIGVLAKRGPEMCLKKWSPTAEYLSTKIPGKTFEVVPIDFEQIYSCVEKGDIDFILANSSFYVELESWYRVNRIATLKNFRLGGAYYTEFGGAIFCKANRNDIRQLNDLKGKTFMAVKETSFGGWRMAWRELKNEGIDPYRDFQKLEFGGTHDAVVYAVKDGKVDAGTIRTDSLERMQTEGKIKLDDFYVIHEHGGETVDLPFLHSTRAYPEWPMAKLIHVSEDLAEKVTVALLQMPPDSHAAIAAKCAGWTIPSNYQTVHECLRELKIGPYKDIEKITFGNVVSNYWHWIISIFTLFLLSVIISVLSVKLNAKLSLEITERKQAEEALRVTSERLELAMDAGEHGFWDWNIDSNEVFFSPRYYTMLGYENKELPMVLDTWINLMHPEDRETIVPEVQKYAENADPYKIEFRLKCKDGSWKWISGCGKSFEYDENGVSHRAVGLHVDITERKQADEALRKSEKKYRTLLETTSEGGWLINSELKTIEVNESLCKMLGYSQDEMIGKTPFDFVDDENRKIFMEQTSKISTTSHRSYGITLKKKDGQDLHTYFNATTIRDESGEVQGSFAFVTDITEIKQAQEELNRLVIAIEQAAESIFITDRDGTIQYVNPAFERLTGYSRKDAIGQNPQILKSGKHDVLFYKQIWDTLTRGDAWHGNIINKKKDGSFYEANATISPVFDKSGKITNFVSIKRDITHETELEKRLIQAQKMEAIGTLAGGIAHDFNNILTSVIGYTELALDHVKKGTSQHENLKEVLKGGIRATDLVKQILTFSRQVDQEQKPIQVKPIVKEVLKLLRASIPSTVEIKQNVQSNALLTGDSTQIHQVLMNLCTNAAHAMADKGGVLTVNLTDIELDSEFVSDHLDLKPGPYINLSVNDTGQGMPHVILEKIFEPFFTTKEKGEGTGMGLSVVHGIVKSHGGGIYADSELGKGSTFQVFLPIIKKHLEPEDIREKPYPTGTERILFIDDEPVIVNIGKQTLESLGYDVVTRTSSIEALEYFKAQPDKVDLVITDMTMPKMTGEALAIELMRIKSDIPVILCTGFSAKIDEEKAMHLNIQAFVSKPILKRELSEIIRKVLDKK
jgi:PAS domain S-box-containing protein